MGSIPREEETSRRVKVLRRILKAENGHLCWTYRQLGRSIGLSPALARAVVQRLIRDGLVVAEASYDADGSQRANVFSITPAGERFYEAAPKRKPRLSKPRRA